MKKRLVDMKNIEKKLFVKKTVPMWVLLVFVGVSLLAFGLLMNVVATQSAQDAVRQYKVAQENNNIMEQSVADVEEWAYKTVLVKTAQLTPLIIILLLVTLLLHGFKIVGR